MVYFLGALCLILLVVLCILLIKMAGMRKAAEEIRTAFAERLREDTNVGIDISSSDRKLRRLAADIDRQLKLLRKEHIRYTEGDRELKDAVTNISHDLRTPLTAICGYMELLEQEEMPEAVRQYLAIISNRIEALKKLTEELFQYSVNLSGSRYDRLEPVVLNDALEECLAAYYGALCEKRIVPRVTMPEGRIIRQMDKAALSRIFGNVVSNAIKYSDGDLLIDLSKQGTITFSNHTQKLDHVSVSRLFDRFYTVENNRNATGLGLSIARTLTEQMGGEISASLSDGLFVLEIRFPQPV